MINQNLILIAIIQARMNSIRLPGKVISPINQKPLLQYLVESIRRTKGLQNMVVATSSEKSDDPIQAFCDQNSIECFRGELSNVASRYQHIVRQYSPLGFVRVSGDSPLLDHRLVEQAIKIFSENSLDVVTNVYPRSFPAGQSVEVVRSSVFSKIYPLITEKEDREHVTRYFYQNASQFKIHNILSEPNFNKIHLAVDTLQDFQTIQKMIERMDKPHWTYSWAQKVALYQKVLSCCE